jgi:hypothetical protein
MTLLPYLRPEERKMQYDAESNRSGDWIPKSDERTLLALERLSEARAALAHPDNATMSQEATELKRLSLDGTIAP